MRVFVLFFVTLTMASWALGAPSVFVFTDINIDEGDPDDRQSLVHLFWYADELDIRGIVPERWNAGSVQACDLALTAYRRDYENLDLRKQGYPAAESLAQTIAKSDEDGIARFVAAAMAATPEAPLYVLVWGNMRLVGQALERHPETAPRIRLLTIGTHLLLEKDRPHLPKSWVVTERPCEQPNWNGGGRQQLFENPRFHDLWWLEMNWTYSGMFTGDEPKEMHAKLSEFGAMGAHLREVTANQPWAQYFRVGDTPTVLYLIDPEHNQDDPTSSSWAGRFAQPFPQTRPNYFGDHAGSITWNYADPCETWSNHVEVRDHARSTLEIERPEMYRALLAKLRRIYGHD